MTLIALVKLFPTAMVQSQSRHISLQGQLAVTTSWREQRLVHRCQIASAALATPCLPQVIKAELAGTAVCPSPDISAAATSALFWHRPLVV